MTNSGSPAEADTPTDSPATNTITGQIVDEKKQGIAAAEVALVAHEIVQRRLAERGRVIASAVADGLGNYSLEVPDAEMKKNSFAAVWARAKGHVAARGNWFTVIAVLANRKGTELILSATEGTRVRVLDEAGVPMAGVRVIPSAVGVPRGVGYPLPKEWEEQSTGTTDADGNAHLPHVDPEALKEMELIPPGDMGILRCDQNYFLNIRPEKAAPHFNLQLPETGSVTGQLVVAEGSKLPPGLSLTLQTHSYNLPQIRGIARVPLDAEGRFHVDKLAVGALFVPAFLPEDQALRANVPARIEVRANEELQLRIPVAPGVKVFGRIRKSDTKAGVKDYELTLIYGPAISNRGPGFDWLKFDLVTDAQGQFQCLLPPGPINLRFHSYADGYRAADDWLPKEQRGQWGMKFEIPARESFDLGTIDLVKTVEVKGRLVDTKNQPLAGWSVYGFPHVPGFTQFETMNSMPGVSTNKEGAFEGSYPETYPPAYWKVSQRVWKTKYEFDDHNYAGRVISRKPLVLQVDTTKKLGYDDEIPIDSDELERNESSPDKDVKSGRITIQNAELERAFWKAATTNNFGADTYPKGERLKQLMTSPPHLPGWKPDASDD